MPLDIPRTSQDVSDLFFRDLSPWFRGDRYWLYKRFTREKVGAEPSKMQEFWLQRFYAQSSARYAIPNTNIARYLSLYHRYRTKISSELSVLWQYLSLPPGQPFETELFLHKYGTRLSFKQKQHLRAYGPYLPEFLPLFHGLSLSHIAQKSLFAKQPQPLLFTRHMGSVNSALHHTLTFSSSDAENIYRPKIRPLSRTSYIKA